jgi:putative transposase
MSDRRQIIDDKLYAHYITFSVYRRRRLLDLDHPKRILLGVLNDELNVRQTQCIGFVIMPEHVHAIVWFPVVGQLSQFVHGWKRKSSFHTRNWYRCEAAHYCEGFGEGEQFWQPKYYSFELFDEAKLLEKLEYIHNNPIRRGLAARTTDWKWSSARWYEWRKPVGIPIAWME